MIHERDEAWEEMCGYFDTFVGTRQFFEMDVELELTSCGLGVPRFKYISERNTLIKWVENVGRDGMKKYWSEKNQVSLDGADTHLLS